MAKKEESENNNGQSLTLYSSIFATFDHNNNIIIGNDNLQADEIRERQARKLKAGFHPFMVCLSPL